MIFTSYTKTDSYYEFVGENGQKLIYPVNTIILTDDESGFIAVKNTASRQTIGLLAKPTPKVRHIIYDAETAKAVTIQYGGSMNAKNCAGLLAKPNIDGGLIGGASLVAADFAVITSAAK